MLAGVVPGAKSQGYIFEIPRGPVFRVRMLRAAVKGLQGCEGCLFELLNAGLRQKWGLDASVPER